MVVATTVLAIIILWSVLSRALDQRGITSALFLTVAGFLVGNSALGWLDITVDSEVAQRVAKPPAADRASTHHARRRRGRCARLPRHGAGIRGVAVHDAGLHGCGVGAEGHVRPHGAVSRVRQPLDVEGGHNDGLAVPFFLVALEIANAELETSAPSAGLSTMAEQISCVEANRHKSRGLQLAGD